MEQIGIFTILIACFCKIPSSKYEKDNLIFLKTSLGFSVVISLSYYLLEIIRLCTRDFKQWVFKNLLVEVGEYKLCLAERVKYQSLGERTTISRGSRVRVLSSTHLLVICSTRSLPFSGVEKWSHFSTILLITICFFFSDFFGANALCMQTLVSGTYVYEYCTANDERLAILQDSTR